MKGRRPLFLVPVVVAVIGAAGGTVRGGCDGSKLLALDGRPNDRFGAAVDIDGPVAVVGAPSADTDGGPGAGAAHVYRFDGFAWVHEARLTASDGGSGDLFGTAVAASGDAVIVGAIQENERGENAGAAYVFRRDGAIWVEEAKLLASDGGPWHHFGQSVAIDGDVAVVGAPQWSYPSHVGAAYVYRRDGSAWIEAAQLLAPDPGTWDEFGGSVSISGDRVAVGAPCNSDHGNCSGSAYVFAFDGSQWALDQKLLAPDAAEEDLFASAVAISGDVVLVGARGDDDNGSLSGSAYVFRRGGDWRFEQKLLADDGRPLDRFGGSAALSGGTAVVGGHLHEPGTCCDLGAAYVFRFDGSTWVREQELFAFDQGPNAQFGYSVAIDGERAIAGAWRDGELGETAGAAYVFADLSTAGCEHDDRGVLWDNGDTDGSGAYSNAVEEVLGSRRTLLDDFVVPGGEWWRVVRLHHTHIWNTLPAGSGEGMEICLRADDGDRPGDVIAQLVPTEYEETATGREMFSRPEATSWVSFEPVVLGPGTYWYEATIVGPENNFWMHRRDIRGSECWVDYDDYGGLQPGSSVFGQPVDLNWQVGGTILPSACPEDLDTSGAVDFGDLLAVLAAWGPCRHQSGCPEDLDDSGAVAFEDLLIVLAAWGPCPQTRMPFT